MAERDPAIARLWQMTMLRLLGIGIVLAGMWVAGKAAGDWKLVAAGLLLMGTGGMISLLVPRAIGRRGRK